MKSRILRLPRIKLPVRGKLPWRVALGAAAAALCIWCTADNLMPRARGLFPGGAEATPTAGALASPDAEAAVGPENDVLDIASGLITPEAPVQEDGILIPWHEPVALATPEPGRATAPVQAKFMTGGTKVAGFSVRDTSDSGLDLEKELTIDPDLSIRRDGSPVILLYSTHSTESFLLQNTDWYYTDQSFRSTNLDESIVTVAEEAARVIEAGGFGVVHDKTVHDYPSYTGGYDRSLETIQRNLEAYPSIQITVDVHRDAFREGDDGTRYKPVTEIDGKSAAQIMIITGCDFSEGTKFTDWRENLHFALRLQQKGEELFPGLYRPLYFCQRNYNLFSTHNSLLIEIGTEVNTLSEAKYSGRLLGETILAMLNDLVEEETADAATGMDAAGALTDWEGI